jgi:hypothetical protein
MKPWSSLIIDSTASSGRPDFALIIWGFSKDIWPKLPTFSKRSKRIKQYFTFWAFNVKWIYG